jgi:L-arabinose isomerase
VQRAVADLSARDVDLLATLHLAYSPSLEAADALASSDLPLLLLDTTPAQRFAEDATMDDMFRNHGIHGVQDLACVLRRRGRAYWVVAGHLDDAAFLQDAVRGARAARAARCLRSMRVLVFGDQFPGMGDFAVEPGVLASTLGITVESMAVAELARRVNQVADEDLATEAAADAQHFDCSGVSPETLAASNRVGLAVRAMLDECGAGAFSFNFQSFDRSLGVPTVPFLEAAKAMARGVGYAGEADALTAALAGALLQGFGQVTFTEMFCPDWAGNAVFMSHMGECNPDLAAARPRLVEKDYAFGNVDNPAVALFPLQPGPATLVNIAPGPDDSFGLIGARLRILDRGLQPGFPDVPHFWIQPVDTDVRDFLRRYSECGGTHHLALVRGDEIEAMPAMARLLGVGFWRV